MLESSSVSESVQVTTVGAVRYLNTTPLIAGLEGLNSVRIRSDVPAKQIGLLEKDVVDLALCSSIDIMRSQVPLLVVPVGMLGCDGPTLTVRLFSKVPPDQITCVHCDRESHTSVELLRILLRECHGIQPQFVEFDSEAMLTSDEDPFDAEAVLLIGDKVVTSQLPNSLCEHQLDLGEVWNELTGMPFVFATWLVRADRSGHELDRIREVARVLERNRLHNRFRLNQIVVDHAPQHGWPIELAHRYLAEYLKFDLDDRALAGLHRFFELAGGSKDSVRLLDGI